MHTWMDEQILILDGIIDSVLKPAPRRNENLWICANPGPDSFPYRITDGSRDHGHYATIGNAMRALEYLLHGID